MNWLRHGPPLLTLFVGLGLSWFAFNAVQEWERQQVQFGFEQAARDRISSLQQSIESDLHAVRSIGDLYKASEGVVGRRDFHLFVQSGLATSPSIQALEWIPRVSNAQRAAYEEAARRDFPQFRITERSAQGEMVPAAERSEFFPVYFVEPYAGNEVALGFDLASNATRLEVLRRARDTGEMLATARTTLIQETAQQFGFLVFLPIYGGNEPLALVEDRRQHLRGFVLGVFRIGDIVEKSVSYLGPQAIDLSIYDDSNPNEEQRLLHLHRAGGASETGPPEIIPNGELHYSKVLTVAGREWSVHVTPDPGYYSIGGSWQPRLVFFGGLLFSGLLAAYVGAVRRRTEVIEQAVQQRTSELREANTALENEIGERKRTARALAEREGRISAILDNVVDAIVTIKDTGIIESFNPAAERIFGFSSDEVVGRNVKLLMPEPYHSEHDGYLSTYLESGEAKIIGIGREVVGRRKDDTTFPMDLAVSELRLGDARLFTGIVRDISERKNIERMKNEFISTVSHELRTPLTSIHGSLGLITGGVAGELSAKAKALLDIAARNSEQLIRLINDILDIEKIESGNMAFHRKPLSLMALVEQAVESNQAYAQQRGSEIVITDRLPSAMVYVDGDRLTQVITNLLSNAAKFSPEGGTISVAVRRQDEGVRLCVTDQGSGIPEEFWGRVFEKFGQADASDTREKGGTGLGLNISKAIVQELGGDIGFETEVGVGTTFYVDLPLSSEPERVVSDARREGAKSAEATPRILICEDDPDIANLLRMMIEKRGQAADIARSAKDAKALLADRDYTAMTLDLLLPDQNGIALLKELRRDSKTRQLPVVVVSAVADEGKSDLNGDAIAVIDWLEKPIDEKRLASAVERALERGPTRRPRILHVEDDADVRKIIASVVGGIAEVSAVGSLLEAEQVLVREDFDLVILDIGLPDGSGISLLPRLSHRDPPIPVVLFSARDVDQSLAKRVAASLVKSRTSNATLTNTIRSVLDGCYRLHENVGIWTM